MFSKFAIANSKMVAFLYGTAVGALGGHQKLIPTRRSSTNTYSIPSESSPSPMSLLMKYLWSPMIVDCSKWDYVAKQYEKFQLKHLLDGFDVHDTNGIKTYFAKENDAIGWSRSDVNKKIKDIMDYNPRGLPNNKGYGVTHRFTCIIKRSKDFNKVYNDSTLVPKITANLQTGLKRNPEYKDPKKAFTEDHGNDMLWYPYKESVIYGNWNHLENSYDIYVIDDVFLLIGTGQYAYVSGRIPNHFEAFVLSRDTPKEEDAFTLKSNYSTAQLQQRFAWAETLDKWWLFSHKCIRDTSI